MAVCCLLCPRPLLADHVEGASLRHGALHDRFQLTDDGSTVGGDVDGATVGGRWGQLEGACPLHDGICVLPGSVVPVVRVVNLVAASGMDTNEDAAWARNIGDPTGELTVMEIGRCGLVDAKEVCLDGLEQGHLVLRTSTFQQLRSNAACAFALLVLFAGTLGLEETCERALLVEVPTQHLLARSDCRVAAQVPNEPHRTAAAEDLHGLARHQLELRGEPSAKVHWHAVRGYPTIFLHRPNVCEPMVAVPCQS
mmetsp:Transcript_66349/g.214428  ORF Transcript_66349/g.214428 Transcript_66349/m.214428 type:complete len:253 (+) Transcript_66349:1862-2620(+)